MSEQEVTKRNEKKSLALSGLIFALAGLLCAFVEGWRIIALVISIAGLLISIFAIRKSRKAGIHNGMSVPGILFALLGIIISGYFLYVYPHVNDSSSPNNIPAELRDSANVEDRDDSKDMLKNIIDTSQGK